MKDVRFSPDFSKKIIPIAISRRDRKTKPVLTVLKFVPVIDIIKLTVLLKSVNLVIAETRKVMPIIISIERFNIS